MSRELSDILIVLIGITVPTIAILIATMLPKWVARRDWHRERARRLRADNAGLRDEIGAVKDRVAGIERIVTDDGHRLTEEIDALRGARN